MNGRADGGSPDQTGADVSVMDRLYYRLYAHRRPVVLLIYGLLGAVGYFAGFLLRFEFTDWSHWFASFVVTVPLLAAVRIGYAHMFHLSIGRWRFISTVDVLRLMVATCVGTLTMVLARWALLGVVTIPLSVLLIEWVITTQLIGALWLGYRTSFERLRHARWDGRNGQARRKIVIVGAGEAGNMLAREIQRYPTGYQLVGFIDDDSLKWGSHIRGAEVIGGTALLPELVQARKLDELLLAVPSAEPEALRRLVESCEAADIPFKVLPGIEEVLEGNVRLNQLRELRIEDLLGREPVSLQLPQLEGDLDNRCVLITGAAGSIGSELARQVAVNRPDRLVLLDQSETALFFLDMELRREAPDVDIVPVIADIADERSMAQVFEQHRPHRVFHAAAYKHVPLLEENSSEAIRNNVIGTRIVAEMAGRHGCGKFVLVSTDKAVRPQNIMGATKRMAELLILAMKQEYPATVYGAVRFGNVLGSNGSVIPIFKKQISEKRPLTVTHPDVTRFFMTIPEAAQLILQASLLEELDGHIAMLDMGQPVKVLDLANNMLRLAGIPPRVGDSIVFTGLRPGEKMHEELTFPAEETTETSIPKVRVVDSRVMDFGGVLEVVDRWAACFDSGFGRQVAEELRVLFKDEHNGQLMVPAATVQPEPALAVRVVD